MSVTNTRTCIDKYELYQQTIEKNRMFSTQKLEISARSRKLPCKNIVKTCDDNNYINSKF